MSGKWWNDSHWLPHHAEELSTDDAFNTAALALFAIQFERCAPYAAYCGAAGLTPAQISHWTEIPAVPTDAFKQDILATFDPATAQRVLMTSGTSAGEASRGKVHKDRAALDLHDALVRDGFRRWCLPDRERIRLLVLAPPEEMVPHLRMAHDCSFFLREFDDGGGAHFINEGGLQIESLLAALHDAERMSHPVMLVGATFSVVRLFDACADRGLQFSLPPGSRLADGGGYKGRSRELTKESYLALASQTLDLPTTHCINLLGITELTSLFFDNTLAAHLAGHPAARHKTNAPWTRTRAVHPDTLEILPPGEVGLLRHWDLGNITSVLALQTEDLGVCFPEGDTRVEGEVGGGFEVLGRASGAELRGCSLAMEQFLEARREP